MNIIKAYTRKCLSAFLKIFDLIGAIFINWILGSFLLLFVTTISILTFALSGLKGLKAFYLILPEKLNEDEGS